MSKIERGVTYTTEELGRLIREEAGEAGFLTPADAIRAMEALEPELAEIVAPAKVEFNAYWPAGDIPIGQVRFVCETGRYGFKLGATPRNIAGLVEWVRNQRAAIRAKLGLAD